MIGTLKVTPLGGRPDRYPLMFVWRDGDDAIFGVEDVKPSSVNVLYSARLADGRTPGHPSEMELVPRPVRHAQRGLAAPARILRQPHLDDGGPYEIQQPRGDVIGIPGSEGLRISVRGGRPRDTKPGSSCAAPREDRGSARRRERLLCRGPQRPAPLKMEVKSGACGRSRTTTRTSIRSSSSWRRKLSTSRRG